MCIGSRLGATGDGRGGLVTTWLVADHTHCLSCNGQGRLAGPCMEVLWNCTSELAGSETLRQRRCHHKGTEACVTHIGEKGGSREGATQGPAEGGALLEVGHWVCSLGSPSPTTPGN